MSTTKQKQTHIENKLVAKVREEGQDRGRGLRGTNYYV